MKTEFTGLEGGVQTPRSVTANGIPLTGEMSLICYPAGELSYTRKNVIPETVIYQVRDLTEALTPFSVQSILVLGYKRSNPYVKLGKNTIKVERVEKHERSQLEEVIRRMLDVDNRCSISFQ